MGNQHRTLNIQLGKWEWERRAGTDAPHPSAVIDRRYRLLQIYPRDYSESSGVAGGWREGCLGGLAGRLRGAIFPAIGMTSQLSPVADNGTLCETPTAHAQASRAWLIAEQRRISHKVCCLITGEAMVVAQTRRNEHRRHGRSLMPSRRTELSRCGATGSDSFGRQVEPATYSFGGDAESDTRGPSGLPPVCSPLSPTASGGGTEWREAPGQRSGSVAGAKRNGVQPPETDRSQGS